MIEKAVMSLWSAPFFFSSNNYHRKPSGKMKIRDVQNDLLCWILSFSLLKKKFNKVQLVTDSLGKKILCDFLELEFDDVIVGLDDINISPVYWCAGKIFSHTFQKEPYIHVDHDVFLWEGLKENLANAEVVVQSVEPFHKLRFSTLYFPEIILNKLPRYMPDVLMEYFKHTDPEKYMACNVGVVGGNNVDFLKKYAEESVKMMRYNQYSSVSNNVHPVVIEQFLLECLIKKYKINTKYLLDIPSEYWFGKSVDEFFDQLEEVAYENKYTHLLGASKFLDASRDLLRKRLQKDYPNRLKKFDSAADKEFSSEEYIKKSFNFILPKSSRFKSRKSVEHKKDVPVFKIFSPDIVNDKCYKKIWCDGVVNREGGIPIMSKYIFGEYSHSLCFLPLNTDNKYFSVAFPMDSSWIPFRLEDFKPNPPYTLSFDLLCQKKYCVNINFENAKREQCERFPVIGEAGCNEWRKVCVEIPENYHWLRLVIISGAAGHPEFYVKNLVIS